MAAAGSTGDALPEPSGPRCSTGERRQEKAGSEASGRVDRRAGGAGVGVR